MGTHCLVEHYLDAPLRIGICCSAFGDSARDTRHNGGEAPGIVVLQSLAGLVQQVGSNGCLVGSSRSQPPQRRKDVGTRVQPVAFAFQRGGNGEWLWQVRLSIAASERDNRVVEMHQDAIGAGEDLLCIGRRFYLGNRQRCHGGELPALPIGLE